MFQVFLVYLLILRCDFSMAKSIQNESDIESKDDSVSKKIEMLELSLKNISEIILEKEQKEKQTPLFFVILASTTTLQTWSIVKFNDIVIDEGGNFNPGDGIFVAPVSGIYMFSWTIQEISNKGACTELRVDNVVKGILNVFLSSSENNDAASRSVLCKVRKGDHVWIQTRGETSVNYFYTYYNSKSSFMGILVKPI